MRKCLGKEIKNRLLEWCDIIDDSDQEILRMKERKKDARENIRKTCADWNL